MRQTDPDPERREVKIIVKLFLTLTHSQHPVRVALRRDYGLRGDGK